jgi:hypothetical protein
MQCRKRQKNFFQMSDREKMEAVKEFDGSLPPSRFKPLSRKQRLLWEMAGKSKPDVSIYVHEGRQDVVIHLDADLLAEARAFAAKNRTTLPKMIDRGLRGLLAFGS